MELSLERVRARLRTPFHAAWGSVSERELVLVRLEDGSGHAGFGEAAPLPGYAGATVEEVCAALQRCGELLAGNARGSPPELIAACAGLSPPPQALAAIDLALWDLEGRRAGAPVWKLLGGPAPLEVSVNATVAGPDAADEAASARRAGFRFVKVKVGLADDLERLAAVRSEVGAETAIRIDANGAWSVGEAVAALRRLEPIGIELCEEPVHGAEALYAVRAESPIPIACDETFAPGATDYACLKITRGGITGVLHAAHAARALGTEVYVASTYDGPLGLAAGVQVAAALRPFVHCGLPGSLDGAVPVPTRPGLGA